MLPFGSMTVRRTFKPASVAAFKAFTTSLCLNFCAPRDISGSLAFRAEHGLDPLKVGSAGLQQIVGEWAAVKHREDAALDPAAHGALAAAQFMGNARPTGDGIVCHHAVALSSRSLTEGAPEASNTAAPLGCSVIFTGTCSRLQARMIRWTSAWFTFAGRRGMIPSRSVPQPDIAIRVRNGQSVYVRGFRSGKGQKQSVSAHDLDRIIIRLRTA